MTDVVAHLPVTLAAASDTRASVRLTGGGAAANTAAWLGVAGVPVALSARLGDDVAGRAQRDALVECGVDVDDLETDPTLPTGACLVMVDATGERTMVPDAGANVALSSVPWTTGEHLHVSAYALFHDTVRDVVLAAARAVRDSGGTVSIDLASSAPLRAFGPDVVRSWCTGALVLANLDEAHVVTGRGDAGDAATVLASWGRAAVVKTGAGGAWCAADDTLERVPVPAVTTDPVDTTGAGDAFAAGLLAASIRGASLAAAAAHGHRTAAEVIGRVGARP